VLKISSIFSPIINTKKEVKDKILAIGVPKNFGGKKSETTEGERN